MTKSELFRKAHALTKKVIQKGDSYRVTFGACIKSIRAELRKLVFAAWTVDFLKVAVGTETADFIQYASNLGGKKRGDLWLFAKRDGKGAIEMLREVYGDVKVVTQL